MVITVYKALIGNDHHNKMIITTKNTVEIIKRKGRYMYIHPHMQLKSCCH